MTLGLKKKKMSCFEYLLSAQHWAKHIYSYKFILPSYVFIPDLQVMGLEEEKALAYNYRRGNLSAAQAVHCTTPGGDIHELCELAGKIQC